jgi:sugar phosphate isomerase/epimerase
MARIKLGICLKSLGLPFRRSLPQAQKLGVQGIELEAAGELLPQNLTQTGRREITHLLRSHDLTVSALTCPLRRGLDDAQDLEPRLEQIRLTMALAFELGPRLVIIPPGRVAPPIDEPIDGVAPKEDPRAALMKESLEALGKHGDRTGVIVALDAGLDEPAALVAHLDRFGVGSLAVNFNPANLVLNGANPYDAVRTYARRLVHAHAQDARRISPSKLATVPLGHGDIDWLQLLANFEEIEYRGYFTVLGDNQTELAASAGFLRRFLA